MRRREYIAITIAVFFGLVGAWLYTSGNEWLANLCVIPPSVYVIKETLIKGNE